jgi:hypothetical protein
MSSATIAAANVAVRLQAGYRAALDAEHRAIADSIATKTSMPEHYWQSRHELAEKLRAAKALVDVLVEER